MRYFLFILFLLSIPFSNYANSKIKIPEPDLSAHKIIDETIDEILKKYDLNPCGIGMNGKFEYLEISFQTRKILTRDEARVMLHDCVEIFLKKINSNEKIKPYLKKYPFDYENVGITLYIQDKKNGYIFHPDISVAKWNSRGLSFKTHDQNDIYGYREITEETHQEALDLIEKSKKAIPL